MAFKRNPTPIRADGWCGRDDRTADRAICVHTYGERVARGQIMHIHAERLLTEVMNATRLPSGVMAGARQF
jgi:hypothetical protein